MAKKTIEIREAGSSTKSGFWEEVKAVLAPGDETEPKPATKLLEEDHARVRDLFDRYEDTRDRATKKRIVDEITRELTLHAKVEEEIFYPRFLKSRGDPQKMVRESFEEHKVVKTLLTELGGMRPSHKQFEAKVTVLKENVLHHAKEEERDLFPEAESRLSKRQLQDMGAEIEDRKEELRQTFEGSRSRRRPSRARTTRRAGSKRARSNRAAHAPARPRSRVSKRR